MDNFCLHALVRELRELLPQTKIRKVRQLHDRQFLFLLHRPCLFDLVLVLDQRLPCLYLRPKKSSAEGPAATSDWLLSIRSHLVGGTVVAIEKELEDRVVTLTIEDGRWTHSPRTFHLRLELIPLRVNAFLEDAHGQVLRTFRPNQPAAGPVSGTGLEQLDRKVFQELVLHASRDSGQKVPRATQVVRPRQGIRGLSPLLLREITHQCSPDSEKSWNRLQMLIQRIREEPFSPRIYPPGNNNQPWICSPFPLIHLEGFPHREFSDMNAAVAETCRLFQDRQRFLEQRHAWLSPLRQRNKKLTRLLKDLQMDLERNHQAQRFKKFSDLLLAQAPGLPAGQTSLRLPDLFQPDQPEVEIPLEPRLTALQNATRYARHFKKSSRAIPRIMTRLEGVRTELKTLEKKQEQIDRSSLLIDPEPQSPLTLPTPLANPTAVRLRHSSREDRTLGLSKLARHFVSSEGLTILVGRGNWQNDSLTSKVAQNHDFWLHVAGYSGSHVVLRNPNRRSTISESSLLEAAQLAAYFSQARNAPKVEVHYTKKKFVAKPKGGKPGVVRLSRYHSIVVHPCVPTSVSRFSSRK